jgi:hypothetical protein
MAYAISGTVKPVLVEDKRVGWTQEKQFGVIKSGTQNTYVVLPTQNYSTSNFNWNAQPPAPNVAINREIFMTCEVTLALTGTAGANGLLLAPGLYDAPRAYPLSQCINNINATINNSSVSLNTYQVINAFTKSNTSDFNYKTDLSVAPSQPDFYQNYDDNYVQSLGVANDPLQKIGQSSAFSQPRGSFAGFVVNSNTATTASVTITTTEPLILSPFLTGTDDENAFIGVQTLTLQVNLINLNRFLSHSAGNGNAGTINSIVATVTSPPLLLLNFITPSKIEPIPKSVIYPYHNTDVYTTDVQVAVGAGLTGVANSNNIQFNTIPRRLYVFLRRNDATSDHTTTDTFARIDAVSINFDNQSGILGGASTQQLYELSKNSGLNMSFTQWNSYTGSLLILDVGRALMLQNENEAPSLQTTKQFQMRVNFTNINPTQAITFSMYIVVISDGIMTVSENQTILQNSILSQQDIMDVKLEGNKAAAWEKPTDFYGGKFFNKIHKFVKDTGLVSKAAMLTGHPELALAANAVGYGLVGGKVAPKHKLLKYRQ